MRGLERLLTTFSETVFILKSLTAPKTKPPAIPIFSHLFIFYVFWSGWPTSQCLSLHHIQPLLKWQRKKQLRWFPGKWYWQAESEKLPFCLLLRRRWRMWRWMNFHDLMTWLAFRLICDARISDDRMMTSMKWSHCNRYKNIALNWIKRLLEGRNFEPVRNSFLYLS